MDFFDLLSVLVVLATVAWGLINWKRNRSDQFGFPDSNLLKTLAAFFATGILLKLFLLAFQKHDTLSDRAGNFLVDIILPYGYGAFVSDFSFVRLLATICGASYAMAICYRGQRLAQTAKNALILITLLSLGTVWLEPFVSMSAATAGILMTLAKVPMKIVDIGVSVFWLIMLWRAFREINRKVGDPWNTPAVSMATVTKLQPGTIPPESPTVEPAAPSAIVLKRPRSINQTLYASTVFVDGVEIGKLRNGQTLSIPVTPGTHELMIKYFMFVKKEPVSVNAGEQVLFTQQFGMFIASPTLRRVKQS